MPGILDSVTTILLVTILGWWLRDRGHVTDEHWRGFEHISFQVFFPALIIYALVKADLKSVPALNFGAVMFGSVASAGLALLAAYPLLNRRFGMSGPAFASVFQGAIRWNTFVAVGLADQLFGKRGLTLFAVAIVAIIPAINVTSVLILRRFGEGDKGRLSAVDLLKNPFIWSSIVGLTINATGLPMPTALMTAADICGKASLPAALLLVGSGLRLADLGRPSMPVLLSSGIKLIGLPMLAAGIGRLAGLTGPDLGVLLVCTAVPTAGAAYIMTRLMGGDSRLMAAIITFETIACAVTLPAMLLLLGG
ncbi:MAG: AEC family transporter [Proteobacteria bacterium]|nr:AEC family transporter [Pseudomonadota bacterium]